MRGYFAQDDGVGWSCAIPGLKSETLRFRSGLALEHPCSCSRIVREGRPLVGFARTLRLRSGQANSVRAGSFDWAQDRLFDSAALRSG